MAKRKPAPKPGRAKAGKKAAGARKSGARPSARTAAAKPAARKATGRRKAAKSTRQSAARGARKAAAKSRRTTKPLGRAPRQGEGTRTKLPKLDRVRRTLEETVPTPPSSLDMDRHGSAARTGRRELAESLDEHAAITPAITGGDVDADWEEAYFTGDEAPGGDNPTPDQDIVEDIGKSLGVEYQDNEELKSSDKVTERDKHRWELDPASSEDYKERE